MKWEGLLKIVAVEPVFNTGFLAAEGASMAQVRLQLDRWVKDGRLIRLRRGLYTLATPYGKVAPEPFVVANAMRKASYVSMQSALGYYGMIPEYVPAVTSVTTARPEEIENPLGRFIFRHIKKGLFFGYEFLDLAGQKAFVAAPEKALFDLVYLTPDADSKEWLAELRLQNVEEFSTGRLWEFVDRSKSKKLKRAAKIIEKFVNQGKTG